MNYKVLYDYCPFGMPMPGRTFNSSEYRYGFQRQEKDDEIKGEGNSVNYKYRMHDPRIGRLFAVDPLTAKYPFYSPYSFSGNRVIDMIELEGLEPVLPGTFEDPDDGITPTLRKAYMLNIEKAMQNVGTVIKIINDKDLKPEEKKNMLMNLDLELLPMLEFYIDPIEDTDPIEFKLELPEQIKEPKLDSIPEEEPVFVLLENKNPIEIETNEDTEIEKIKNEGNEKI